jgi:8-amino-7-oxononanoate synthase
MSDPVPASRLDQQLAAQLSDFAAAGLRRELRRVAGRSGTIATIDGRPLVNFSSNDYLGLSLHPALKAAAVKAVTEHGAGSAASRLVCGSLAIHHELEAHLADWCGTPAALAFSSGFAAAMGTIPALVGADDVVILDKLTHACCIDAARLSGARIRVFRHNDLDMLADHLRWADSLGGESRPRVLVITESVFSMDGDRAPLRELVELKDRHGAFLLLDEAHAAGLLGPGRAGLADALGLRSRVDIHMGTLGKAVGSAGGFIAGSQTLVDYLIHRARSFVFSTAPVPAAAAAAMAGVTVIRSDEGARLAEQAWTHARVLSKAILAAPEPVSTIIPWNLGDERRAVEESHRIRDAGFLAPAIRYPTVARGQARIRFTVSAAHTSDQVEQLLRVLDLGNPRTAAPT